MGDPDSEAAIVMQYEEIMLLTKERMVELKDDFKKQVSILDANKALNAISCQMGKKADFVGLWVSLLECHFLASSLKQANLLFFQI